MTTSKLVTTCNVEALDPTEAKAAFLSLYKQQRHWIEITNDPATWPPANVVVLTQDAANVIGMHFHGNSHKPLWWQPENMFVDAPPGSMDGPIAWKDYSLSDSQDITHWRPI